MTTNGIAIRTASATNASDILNVSISFLVRFGAMNPATPTPALMTPTARPRLVANHGAISIEVGTSETAAVPIPNKTQNA